MSFAMVVTLIVPTITNAAEPTEATEATELETIEPAPTEPSPAEPSPPPADLDDEQAKRDGRTALAAGLSLFGGSYFNMITGGVTLMTNGTPEPGRRMLIPFVGPFLAAAKIDGAIPKIMLSVAGLVQIAGATGIVIGLVRYTRYTRGQPEPAAELSLGLAPASTGGGAVLRYRF